MHVNAANQVCLIKGKSYINLICGRNFAQVFLLSLKINKLCYLLFQESIASEFFNKLVQWIKNIKISDPLEEGCRLGPVISEGQVYFLCLISVDMLVTYLLFF